MFPHHLFLAHTELELQQQNTARYYELLLAVELGESEGSAEPESSARKRLLLGSGRLFIRVGLALQNRAGYEYERPQLAK